MKTLTLFIIQKSIFFVLLFFSLCGYAQENTDFSDLSEATKNVLKVKRLDLGNKNLQVFPKEILEMKNIETLDISVNQIKEIPAGIGQLKKLKVLNIYQNIITKLPNELGDLDSLNALNLYYNQIEVLPATLGKLKNITDLYLHFNQLKELPKEIGMLENLERIDISNNQISTLPQEFYGLKKLQIVNLTKNKLTNIDLKLLDNPNIFVQLNKNKINQEDFLLQLSGHKNGDVIDLVKYLVQTKEEKLGNLIEKVCVTRVGLMEKTKTNADSLLKWYNLTTFVYIQNKRLKKAEANAIKSIAFAKKNIQSSKDVPIIRQLEQDLEESKQYLTNIEKELNLIFLRQLSYFLGFVTLLFMFGFMLYFYFSRKKISAEKAKGDKLLLNILPKDVAEELKENGITTVRTFSNASILFADVKGFSKLAGRVTPQALIKELDLTFGKFDEIINQYGLERVKTIGDCYMCVGGVPVPDPQNPVNMTLAALQIQKWMSDEFKIREKKNEEFWEVRLGIHVGDLVAGVIGKLKFAYDVWGNSVNTASRMESGGEVGRVNITSFMHDIVKDFFMFESRGKIEAKNIGLVETYFVLRIKPEFSEDTEGFVPNQEFFNWRDKKFPKL